MRVERPFFADIYPAGERTCDICGDGNLAGESFQLSPNHFLKHLCADCYEVEERKAKEKERLTYVSGEEEPWGTNEIVCPWCGYEFSYSWEFEDYDDEFDCYECNKTFEYQRHVEVTYSSSRVKE